MMIKIIKKTIILSSLCSLFTVPAILANNNKLESLTPSTNIIEEPLTFDDTQPKRLKITVNIYSPEDIQVKEGEIIKKGDIISDRTLLRKNLENQLRSTKLALNNIKSSKVLEPIRPIPTPPIQNLPPANFAQEEAQVETAELEYVQAQRAYALALENDPFISIKAKVNHQQTEVEEAIKEVQKQGQKTASIAMINNLPTEVIEHEKYKLGQKQSELSKQQANFDLTQAELKQVQENRIIELQNLQDKVNSARAKLELANAKLRKAKSDRSLLEYNHSINTTVRIEEANQAQIAYNRQQQEYQQQVRDKEYKVTQLTDNISNLEDKLSSIAVVKSPYSGQIKKIKYENQTDNTIKVEITLVPDNEK
ncbi:hypothetical protein WEU38_11095 [Cyanobacterium aponinum AL20118]|uniref:HlyD family secretion protein n=1 Tax=Cyanobacterium aponinum AL20115 TaxID=3090662 RepID=A0AAF0ZBP9_9CHRO|nr:hypothetical protein [Cyanobacterium aponinum]WPF87358.1 hypothetical protein SAY89_11125 [Cyanobacterium aponinum AL20115]